MKQIMPNITQTVPIIELKDALSEFYNSSSHQYIAYETQQKTGLAVLVNLDGHYGFVYHTSLLKGQRTNAKYTAPTAKEAIAKAMDKRTVLLFDTYVEFIEHSIHFTKL